MKQLSNVFEAAIIVRVDVFEAAIIVRVDVSVRSFWLLFIFASTPFTILVAFQTI